MIPSILSKTIKRVNTLSYFPKRFFDLHEFQSKVIMREIGLNVQKGAIAATPEEAEKVANSLSKNSELVIKCQVHAGGRGKGTLSSGLQGGVKICKTGEEIRKFAKQMIGYNIVTKQTTKDGLPVKSVLVHEAVDIDKQLYLAITMDRKHDGPVIVASKNGGMDIEEVAHKDPNSIKIFPVSFEKGLDKAKAQEIVDAIEIGKELRDQAVEQLIKLYQLFIKTDATIVEINPWATTPDKKSIYCVDAKITIDDNALYRQQKLVDLQKSGLSTADFDPNEEKAKETGLNYVGLDGNIGCMVNGAGLAMSTMDIIKLKGGEPANFLDVGGSASVDQVRTAFEILTSHTKVKAILVNIFGGIMRCDTIAEGIIKASEQVTIKVPLIVRLTGTNVEKGKAMLREFAEKNKGKIIIETADSLDEAATKAVNSLKK